MKTFVTDEIVGAYRIVRPLGTGGMGMVYEVEHTKLKVHRALKVFAVENEDVELHRKRFLSEGKILSALDHSRVVRVHEFDVDDRSGLPYFVMDLVLTPEGVPRTLEDMRREGMDEHQAAVWFKDICIGLAYIHSLGIVHRDIKLENVLIGPDGHAVLSDFGISRIFDDDLRQRLDITLTMPQDEKVLNCLGTVHYLAPELQGANPEKATIESDAWALGVLLFRLLTGFWFESGNREKCFRILKDYDHEWSPLVDRLCAENPVDRIPSGGFADLVPLETENATFPLSNRRGWLWCAAGAFVVITGVVGLMSFKTGRAPNEDCAPVESASFCNPTNSALCVSVNFEDLKLMNGGEHVLIPGIAAETKYLSLAWDKESLTNTHNNTNLDPLLPLIHSARPYSTNPIRGIRIEILEPSVFYVSDQESMSQSLIPNELCVTNLTSVLVHLEPALDFSSTSNVCLTAELRYDQSDCADRAVAWLQSLVEGVDPAPVMNQLDVTNATVRIAATWRCYEGGKIAEQLVAKVLKAKMEEQQRARSRAADTNNEVVPIPAARQAAVRQTEEAYLRRQLYDPVVQALANEPVETQESWKSVLTTAEILMESIAGDAFDTRREFVGKGAVNAYKNGCRYPLPIAYAYASKNKFISTIQMAYSNLYVNLEHDMRWNTATRLQFFGLMAVVDKVDGQDLCNAPSSLTNACHQALVETTRQFLVEQDYTADEIGMVFHLVRRSSAKFDMCAMLDDIRKDGIELDLWLDTMLRAKAARDKAWAARGDGYANTVTSDGARIYDEELNKAFVLLEKAYRLRPELSWSCQLALQCAFDDGYARELWLRRLWACNQGLARGLSFYLWALRPRWGGSRQEMVDFLLDLAQKRQFDTMIPIFAYERMVTDVFASEGGISLRTGEFPNVDKYILSLRDVFHPYFEGYRQSRLEERLPFIRKVHLYIALADLAWRLEDENELLYWSDRFKSLLIPASETHFSKGYYKFAPYLEAIRKLEGTRRHDFLVGLHAMDMDGNPAAIDKMKQIAEEIGETQLAFNCVLSRKGTVDLRPFVKSTDPTANSVAKELTLNFNGHQRDHMIFRCKLRSSKNRSYTLFRMNVHCGTNRGRSENPDAGFSVLGHRGASQYEWVNWPVDEDTCSFELEIVGNRARLTQNGVCLQEKRIADLPSLCSYFDVIGFFGIETTILKLELEVLDGMNFVIPSVPQKVGVPLPADTVRPEPSWRKYDRKAQRPIVGGVECAYSLDGRDINECGMRKNPQIIEGREVYTMGDGWDGYCCPLNEIDAIKDACTIIFECGPFLKSIPNGECMLGSFSLSANTWGSISDRVMAVADTSNGDVYAVAHKNKKRWKGSGRIDLNAFPYALAFAYDYAHGLVVYQRAQDGKWTTLVASDKCRYQGEVPKLFWLGRSAKTGLPYKHLVGLTIRSVSVYPKVLTAEELQTFSEGEKSSAAREPVNS